MNVKAGLITLIVPRMPAALTVLIIVDRSRRKLGAGRMRCAGKEREIGATDRGGVAGTLLDERDARCDGRVVVGGRAPLRVRGALQTLV